MEFSLQKWEFTHLQQHECVVKLALRLASIRLKGMTDMTDERSARLDCIVSGALLFNCDGAFRLKPCLPFLSNFRGGRNIYQIKRGKLRSLERRWIASRAVPATVPRISLRVLNICAIHMYVEPKTKDSTAGRGSPEEPVERT